MGTEESLLQAANFVQMIQARQGLRIACIEEIAYRKGFITGEQVKECVIQLQNGYGQYLRDILARPV